MYRNNKVILLLFSTIIICYHIHKAREKQRMVLQQMVDYLQNNYKEEQVIKSILKDVVSIANREMYQSLMGELEQVFLPDQLEDNKLKLDFVNAIGEEIQANISITLRDLLNREMKSIAEEVISDKASNEEGKSYRQNLCSSDLKLPPHQKVLSYTVFGTRKLYYEGIPKILREAMTSNLYYDWRIRIYHDGLITPEVSDTFKGYKNLDLCDARYLPRYGNITNILGTFWRDVPMADKSVDIMCLRDLDSALLTREEDAVKEFLESGKFLHTMRDYPQHKEGMLGGMWCIKPVNNRSMARNYLETILKKAVTYTLNIDQPLLNKVIWDNIYPSREKYVMQHDSFFCKHYEGTIPFPTKRKDNMEFVGCPGHSCNWRNMPKCPKDCRPKNHQDWEYC